METSSLGPATVPCTVHCSCVLQCCGQRAAHRMILQQACTRAPDCNPRTTNNVSRAGTWAVMLGSCYCNSTATGKGCHSEFTKVFNVRRGRIMELKT